MNISTQTLNDYFKRLTKKRRISTKVRTGIVIGISLLVIFGLVRSCANYVLWKPPVYRIARDKTWYPIQLYDKERNLMAFTDEMLVAISKLEKIQMELFLVGPDNLFMGLDNEQYDGVLSSLQPNSHNRDQYLFSDPFYKLGPVLIVHEGSTAKSLGDMENKIIGIRTGSSVVFNIEQYPEIIIRSYESPLLGLMDLDKNVIDGVILDALTAYIYTSGLFAKRLKIVGTPLTDIGLRLLTRHSSPDLIKHFNSGLKQLKVDGTYDQLINKWGLFNTELRAEVKPPIPAPATSS